MSLGKLLATGRSLMASQGGAHRYRANKRVALPKFGSLKNPFASGAQQERAEARPTAAVPTEAKVRATNAPASPAALRKPVPVRLSKWASGWSAKLNPFGIWRRRRATGLETTDAGTSAVPVQRELSLESVRVVCNDLTDADAEASGKGKRANPAAESGMRGMTAKAEVAMDRLSAKLFGSVDA
jgi:hypothetical protein